MRFGLCACVVGNGRGYMKVKLLGAPISQDAVQREGEEERRGEITSQREKLCAHAYKRRWKRVDQPYKNAAALFR